MASTQSPPKTLFNEPAPPQRGEVSDRTFKRRHVPAYYSKDFLAEYGRVVTHWNKVFKPLSGKGGYRANKNDATNKKAYHRFVKHCADSNGEFDYREPDVIKAIDAYRNNPNNVRAGAWNRFVNWINVENVDRFVGKPQAEVQQARAAADAEHTRQAAALKQSLQRIIDHRGLVKASVKAHTEGKTLSAKCKAFMRDPQCTAEGRNWCEYTRGLIANVEALGQRPSADLLRRAMDIFQRYYGHFVGLKPDDTAKLYGIQLSLRDQEIARNNKDNPQAARGEMVA